MKKVKDVIKVIENFAPKILKEDFDNVGLMVGDKEKEVKKVLLALDCTLDVIEEAKEKSIDLIITHHPLIFKKPNSITTETLLGKKIIKLIQNDISLYSSHTNLDSAKNGLNETIVKVLGFEKSEILELNKNSRKDKKDGIGRLVTLDKEIYIEDLIKQVKEKLNIKALRVVLGTNSINKIAIINGSGQDFFDIAIKNGANCIITGDTTYHYASDYKEMGITIVDVGHFASEWIVYQHVISLMNNEFNSVKMIISDRSKDPYMFL